jgi:uncharacterized protein YceK
LSGCGTVTTLTNSDESVAANLKNRGTYCETLPRVYSGVSYDICSLHSNPNATYVDVIVALYLIDIAASAVGDTLALPYSIYAQSKYNYIKIDGRQ